jgi:hypothetical protein
MRPLALTVLFLFLSATAHAEPELSFDAAIDRQITLPGTSNGTATGLTISTGDRIRFSATGTVDTQPLFPGSRGGPDGNGSPCTGECLLPSASFGALIGKIGSGPWFLIGQLRNVTATRSGALVLAVNDTVFDDNEGQYRVAVHIDTSAPPCAPNATTLCLAQNRFRVQVSWRNAQGQIVAGRVVSTKTAESGLFWFSSSTKWDLLVNVLNSCSANNRYWVFAAATTNVQYTVRVTDTRTGAVKEYVHAQDAPALSVMDIYAFATCP